MRGGTSSGLTSGYSTFLRLRSDARCCRRQETCDDFFASGVRARERHGRTVRVTMNGESKKRRSAVGDSDGKKARAATHREASRRRGVQEPHARWKFPRAASGGASAPRFQVSGFWGSIRRRRTFLGLVLVWPLVALGLTCVAARTTRRTGAPIMTAMFLCVEWRERGAARSEGATDADCGNRRRKRRKENEEAWPAVRPRLAA